MVQKTNITKRSPMNVSVASRLLGVAITIFILILTIKSELLDHKLIVFQITLSMPFLLVSMMTNAKIVDKESFKNYYMANRITNSIGIALIMNSLGLLVTNYISRLVGIIFLISLLILFSWLLLLDFNKRKFYNEILIILLLVLLGFVPAIIGV